MLSSKEHNIIQYSMMTKYGKGGARQKNKEYAEKWIDQKWHESPMSSDHQILSASSGAGTQKDGEDKASVWVRGILTPITNLLLTFHIFYQVPTTATQIWSQPQTIPRLSKKNGTQNSLPPLFEDPHATMQGLKSAQGRWQFLESPILCPVLRPIQAQWLCSM